MKEINKKSAWIVEWKGTDKKYMEGKDIIAIFDSRKSPDTIKDFVENYYMSSKYSIYEKAYYSSHRKLNPYPAKYDSSNGVIHCGHNPFISAKLVKNLHISVNDDGAEILAWE